jgi:hypothetical protein
LKLLEIQTHINKSFSLTQHHMTSTKGERYIDHLFSNLKEGQSIQVNNQEKTFTKMGGLIVASEIDSYNWIKSQVSETFFNTYVGRLVSVRPRGERI